jgi:hypothetical protein
LHQEKINLRLKHVKQNQGNFENRARTTKCKSRIEASEATTKGFEVEHHQQNLDLISMQS